MHENLQTLLVVLFDFFSETRETLSDDITARPNVKLLFHLLLQPWKAFNFFLHKGLVEPVESCQAFPNERLKLTSDLQGRSHLAAKRDITCFSNNHFYLHKSWYT